MKLDILAIGAHPDDVELACGGTMIIHQQKGYQLGVLDLTRGEMGTRGSVADRNEEAAAAAQIMKLTVRENLDFKDAFFVNDEAHQLKLINKIRKYQPEIILTNALYDRHPDHGRAAGLVEEAVFKAGLSKIHTEDDAGNVQKAWRPKRLFHFIQSVYLEPDFLVDISDAMELKMAAIRAYKSQFYDPGSNEPDTYISSPLFLKMIEARCIDFGQRINVRYAEGFNSKQIIGVNNLFDLL